MNVLQAAMPTISILLFAPLFVSAERNKSLLVIPTNLFGDCALHFMMENTTNIKHENIEFPYSFQTYSYRMDEIGEASFKRHWIFCYVLVPVLNWRKTRDNNTLHLREAHSAIELTELMKHPLMVTIMSKPNNQSYLHPLIDLLTIKGTQVLCKFLFVSFIEKGTRSSQHVQGDSSNEVEVTGGACFCSTCYREYKGEIVYQEFSCAKNRSQCFEELHNTCRAVSDNGARVAWAYEGVFPTHIGTNMMVTTKGTETSPMNVRNITRMHNYIQMYLFRGVNWTNYQFDPLNNYSTPAVSTGNLKWHNDKKFPAHGEMYPVGISKSYRFITNAEVYRPKATSGNYLSPLRQPVMRCLLAIQVLLVTVMVVAWKKSRCVADFVLGFIWVSATLIEQSQRFPVETKIRKYIRLVFLLWLFLAIVLSNAYKSVVKSEFMVEAPYATYLKSFQNISSFSTYILTTNADCRGNPVQLWKANHTSSEFCHGTKPVDEEFRRACSFLKRISVTTSHLSQYIEQIRSDGYTHNRTDKIYEKRNLRQVFEIWKRNVWSLCLPYVNASDVIASLDVPKDSAAFIVPDAAHEYYRVLFDDAKRLNHTLRYALNQKCSDDDLSKSPALLGTEKLDVWAGTGVAKHTRALLSSGIYWFWEKWEAIMFPEVCRTKLPRGKPSPTNDPPKLSLRTARVYQAFRWYFTGIGLAANRFIYERVSCSLRYQVLRLNVLAVWIWIFNISYKARRILTGLRSLFPGAGTG